MSARYTHKSRTLFTCVDNYPDLVDGTSADTNGAVMYHVEADCSTGLPCAPYDAWAQGTFLCSVYQVNTSDNLSFKPCSQSPNQSRL